MSYLFVVPSIAPSWTADCLNGLDREPAELLIIDNSIHNIGVAAAWNQGALRVLAEKRDWLILLSAGVRFGASRGRDFVDALDEHAGAACVEAAHDIGWHLLAISRRALRDVGLFDEGFFAYYEDNDWGYRFRLTYDINDPAVASWPKVDTDARLYAKRHGVDVGGAVIDWEATRAYYRAKWGALSPDEIYVRPFDDPRMPVAWWPEGYAP